MALIIISTIVSLIGVIILLYKGRKERGTNKTVYYLEDEECDEHSPEFYDYEYCKLLAFLNSVNQTI